MTEDPSLQQLTTRLQERGLMIVTAESCTAGLVAKLLTDPAGSSAWFDRGFVTYSDISKIEVLGVARQTLSHYGAVSRETVREMVTGALNNSHAQVALAISGIAGPSGGSIQKPVGTIWFAWAAGGKRVEEKVHFDGNRDAVRNQAAQYALSAMVRILER